jgi:hypothetical protein
MSKEEIIPKRFIGLDIHKHYLVATGLDTDLNQVYSPRRVQLEYLENWMRKELTVEDAVVLEMTTNTWQVYDELLLHVHSVLVVHPVVCKYSIHDQKPGLRAACNNHE